MKKLILKFITNTINPQELHTLHELLKNSKNKQVLKKHLQDCYDINLLMAKLDTDKAYKKILKDISKKEKNEKQIIPNLLKYAAMLIGIVGFVYFFQHNKDAKNQISTQNRIDNSNAITLTLSNGEKIYLDGTSKYCSNNVEGDEKKLFYSQKNDTTNYNNKIAYNYLTIPKGSNYFVQLSDETKVWLNSDSKLKYPESFNNGETRKVELIYGEAYFEVSSSKLHHGDSFNVLTKSQEINVLGTHFNVKAYQDDHLISTTLLEGKVRVSNGINSAILIPSQQSKSFNDTNLIEVLEVDTSHEVAWIKGNFSFNQDYLEEIMKVLTRSYDIEVVFKSEKTKKYELTGILKKTSSIEDILKFFESISDGDLIYKINGRKIIIE